MTVQPANPRAVRAAYVLAVSNLALATAALLLDHLWMCLVFTLLMALFGAAWIMLEDASG